jgi:hypothetical protein
MLYVRYVHLTKGQAYPYEINPSSRQGGCYVRTMIARVQLQKKILVVILKGLGAKTNCFAVNRQSQSDSDSDSDSELWLDPVWRGVGILPP